MTIIIPRSVWKPRYANGFALIGVDEWLASGKELWLHHSVTNPFGPDATLEQDCQHMRDFEQIGQSRFGGGISYTWVTMPSGRVFQGHDTDRQGSHTYQRNNRARAICLAGRYHENLVSDRMVRSVALLLREIGATIDGPHSAVYPTDCPGDYARARLGEMNALATSGAPIEGDDDMATPAENWAHPIADPGAPGKEPPAWLWLQLARIDSRTAKDTAAEALAAAKRIEAKVGTVTLTPEQIAQLRSGLAAEVADLLADRLKD